MSGVELDDADLPLIVVALGLLAQRIRADGRHHALPAVGRLNDRLAAAMSAVPPLAPPRSTRASSEPVSTAVVKFAAEMAGVSRERMTFLVRTGRVGGERTAGGWLVDVRSLERWMAARDDVKRPSEDRAHHAGEARATDAPDPRNVAMVAEWDPARQGIRNVTRNFEERAAFVQSSGMGNPALPKWSEDPDVATVGEVRRLGLSDVRVVCPRNVVHNGFVVHVRGEVIDWSTAALYDVVEALPTGWSAWRGVA